MIWTAIHILEIILWCIIACSVAYVVFFAFISLFYDKDDQVAIHAAALKNGMTRFLILYPAYKEDSVIVNAVEQFLTLLVLYEELGEATQHPSVVHTIPAEEHLIRTEDRADAIGRYIPMLKDMQEIVPELILNEECHAGTDQS